MNQSIAKFSDLSAGTRLYANGKSTAGAIVKEVTPTEVVIRVHDFDSNSRIARKTVDRWAWCIDPAPPKEQPKPLRQSKLTRHGVA